MTRKIFIAALVLLVMTPLAEAMDIGGASLPETMAVGGRELILNGAGLRKKLFIKIYAGGLYLREKSRDAEQVIAKDEPMAIRMHFVYDGVSSEKLISAWNEGFLNATGGQVDPIKEKVDAFNAFFTEEARKGDIYDIVYTPGDGLSVYMKGKHMGRITGLDFKKAVFGIWLGKKPADKSLKKGMLGK